MIKSMTGYGRAVQNLHGREFTVEIKSVNNRYLDCGVRLPRAYSFCEDEVKQQVKGYISRGKVDIYVSVSVPEESDQEVVLNRPVLEAYLNALRSVSEDYGVIDDISVMKLASLPDVFALKSREQDEDEMKTDLLSVTAQALERFNEMRTREGAALQADLEKRSATILALTERVEERSPVTLAEYRTRLENKIREVLENTAIDEARILTEAAIYADKIAVDEETVRLKSHLDQLGQMLRDGGAIGRKLDFLLQELNREANTIGSKGNDLEQARTVVEIKAELEKIREQAQNIE
ncbi:MAG: YicC family protein [Oscillospiraceae bacterium]|nr:YicC family protein [Oscillospiraceae bacterium]